MEEIAAGPMTGRYGARMDLGHLCEELPDLRRSGGVMELEQALAAIRSGTEAWVALRESGLVDDADADAVSEGDTRSRSTPPRVEGAAAVVRGAYVCPERRCSRRVVAAGSNRPTCGVFDRFLEFDGGLA
ncbi:hypothetical protein GCM10007979_39540 [Nocardioides albus]|nr:hypothetical protein GCM10007979_39540 [Nocardioides albus]